jgi:uncharacterized membrane protein
MSFQTTSTIEHTMHEPLPAGDAGSASTTPPLSKHRIEALVDGIFAVAMTLLVIDLRLPERGHVNSVEQLAGALADLAPNFSSWLVSFIVLAIFWVGNHRLYSHVRHVDGKLVWYTILMLGGASLLPFATAVNSQFPSQLGQAVYSSVMIVIAFGALLVATHIHRTPALCAHPMDRDAYRGVCLRTIGLMVVAMLAVLLAGVLPGTANMAFLLIFALRRVGGARRLNAAR